MIGAETKSEANFSAEHDEVQWLLDSGVFGRSTNLTRLFKLACDKYFSGHADQIKEYTLAVEGLGRPFDFDPQSDPIVRVTVHALRKRLAEYYSGEGRNRPVRISLPLGHYVPSFTHHERVPIHQAYPNGNGNGAVETVLVPQPDDPDRKRFRPTRSVAAIIAVAAAGILFAAFWQMKRVAAARVNANLAAAASKPGDALHVLVGENRSPYTDHSGIHWVADRYCTGGTPFAVLDEKINGTEDPEIYLAGRRGSFHCVFPVPKGYYQVQLHFADTSDAQDGATTTGFSFNGGSAHFLDVVDSAPGQNTATAGVYPGITTEQDGAIHIDFLTGDSFVNAIEVAPDPQKMMLPLRMTMGPKDFIDAQGQVWLSDRYFTGGRRNYVTSANTDTPNSLYYWSRVGHFEYSIPVAANELYTVKLHFLEPWFGNPNSGMKGMGGRIFDVYSDGTTLLENFDVYAAGGSGPVVRTFTHIQPTAQGKINLIFMPVVNYGLLSALEVIPEVN